MKIAFEDLERIRLQLSDIIAKLNPHQTIVIDEERIRVVEDSVSILDKGYSNVTGGVRE